MKYEVAIEPGSGAYAFSLTVPDLPGCYAVGKTLEEAMRNLKEASVIWVKGEREDVHRHFYSRCAALAQGLRPRLGHRRILDAAACHRRTHRP